MLALLAMRPQEGKEALRTRYAVPELRIAEPDHRAGRGSYTGTSEYEFYVQYVQ